MPHGLAPVQGGKDDKGATDTADSVAGAAQAPAPVKEAAGAAPAAEEEAAAAEEASSQPAGACLLLHFARGIENSYLHSYLLMSAMKCHEMAAV